MSYERRYFSHSGRAIGIERWSLSYERWSLSYERWSLSYERGAFSHSGRAIGIERRYFSHSGRAIGIERGAFSHSGRAIGIERRYFSQFFGVRGAIRGRSAAGAGLFRIFSVRGRARGAVRVDFSIGGGRNFLCQIRKRDFISLSHVLRPFLFWHFCTELFS